MENQAQQQLDIILQFEDEEMEYYEACYENLLVDEALAQEDEHWSFEYDEFLLNYNGPDKNIQQDRDDLIYDRWAASCSRKHPDEEYDDHYLRNLDPFELDGEIEEEQMPPEDYTDAFFSDWYDESGHPPEGLAHAHAAAAGQPAPSWTTQSPLVPDTLSSSNASSTEPAHWQAG
jgi:hypothetical protein